MADSTKEFVLVTEYFHPDTASTGQLMTDLAVGLQNRGLDVTVYTGQPNYHSGENERQPREETHEGVLVKRIRAPQMRQSSLSRRLFNWGMFTVWMFFVLLVSQTDRDRELLFVSNPPFLPIALWLVSRIRGWEYTYIVYDLYPDQPVELGYLAKNGLIARGWERLHAATFRDAKHVVALGPAMRERIIEQAGPGFDEAKIAIIHNWEDGEFIEPIPKRDNWFSQKHDLVDPFTVLYSGNIAEFHDLETLIKAASAFQNEDVVFMIIGEGDNKESIVTLAENLGVRGDTVRFLPYQPWEDLPYSLTAGDVSIVTVKDGFKGVCVSSKLYSAMAAGRPVLCVAKSDDDEARIIDVFDAGFQVKQGDVDGIIDAIETWRTQHERHREQSDNARTAFEEYFSKDDLIDRYFHLLTSDTVEPDVTAIDDARHTSPTQEKSTEPS